MISAGHRHDVQTWCLDNDFELVELEAEVGSEEDGNKFRKLCPGCGLLYLFPKMDLMNHDIHKFVNYLLNVYIILWINTDEFQETTGIKRIVQALHSHMWPNMVLKGELMVPVIR